MSFAAVIPIVALHGSAPVRAFMAPREEGWASWTGRRIAMLFVTGMVIEIALMPIVLFHFHRAGLYGAFAGVIAIPLVTGISMPLIALALLDVVGLGAPCWWIVGQSLDLLSWIAHFTASRPGAVKLMPQMTGRKGGAGRRRRPVAGAMAGQGAAAGAGARWSRNSDPAVVTPIPDLLVSGDGRHVGITGEGNRLLVLRDSRSQFTRDNRLELAGAEGEPMPLANWPGARCSRDFCAATLERGGRAWHVLMARSRDLSKDRRSLQRAGAPTSLLPNAGCRAVAARAG